MNRWMQAVGSVSLACAAALAQAKLPPPSEEAKAKAAEAAAKAAHGNKVGAFQLCAVMDKLAARYLAESKKSGKDVQPMPTPACVDPGPYVAVAPAAKPIEAAGAHSPPATATSPPSTTTPAAEMNPAKKP
jgi:hypothetical protein